MSTEAYEVAQAVIASLGGGALIVIGCSTWLGKIWAKRILESDRNKYALDMESIRQANKTASEALKVASSTHSESIRIYSELRCNAVTQLWKDFLRIKKLIPLSVFYLDLIPNGRKVNEILTPVAIQETKDNFTIEKRNSLNQLDSDEFSPYLEEKHLDLLLLYRKAIYRIHYCYEELERTEQVNINAWRSDNLLSKHFELVFDSSELLAMQSEKWTARRLLTFIEKQFIGELRDAVTGESASRKILEQAMKNIELVSELNELELKEEANKNLKSDN